jgi:ubiquinol-cytochrome c reductase cytochrome b/c1 subunit
MNNLQNVFKKQINFSLLQNNISFNRKKIDNPFTKILKNHIIFYPTPKNINYGWSFGSLAGLFFALQIITGIFLAMHYIPNVELAFWSVEHIMRDVNYGWLLRYMHANGASMVFITMYIHIGKALYFRSYAPGHGRAMLFFAGIVIFLLMMGTAFIGYVLPWGQMSLWGATVITNLITAIPFIGESIAYWIWGGFSVGNPTLNRFFSFHYLLPFLVIGIIFLHLTLLHLKGSTNPLGTSGVTSKIYFHPYFTIKDAFSFFLALLFFSVLIFFYPNALGHPDNYIMANSLVTPPHIVPEWYFLPFYAILRAVPNKIGGVVAMIAAILIFLLLPFNDTTLIQSPRFSFIKKFLFGFFVLNFFLLGFFGGQPADKIFVILSAHCAVIHFAYVLFSDRITNLSITQQTFSKQYVRQDILITHILFWGGCVALVIYTFVVQDFNSTYKEEEIEKIMTQFISDTENILRESQRICEAEQKFHEAELQKERERLANLSILQRLQEEAYDEYGTPLSSFHGEISTGAQQSYNVAWNGLLEVIKREPERPLLPSEIFTPSPGLECEPNQVRTAVPIIGILPDEVNAKS